MYRNLLTTSLVTFTYLGRLALAQETLLITPGDTIRIQVFDTPEMEQHPRVTDAGTAPLLFIGNVQVAGLTPGDAATLIETTLKEKQYMLHPRVSVTIEDVNTEVSVLGQVKDPGAYVITAPTSIISVLSMAGGLADLANRHIAIQRHGDVHDRLEYFLSNDPTEALNSNIMVDPGDTVLVPKAPIVYVMGDVARPGGYPIVTNDSKMSILQALALAGEANHTAVLSKVRLIRKKPGGAEDQQIDLASVRKGKTPDVPLQEDDILFVPFSWMKNVALASSAIAQSAASALIYAHP
jgi:polysaccharide export outer membrane protein